VSLAIIVPLHAGFTFGLNVHTLAYGLMMMVVMSGIWGAMQFSALAPQIQSHRGGATVKKLLEQQILLTNDIHGLGYQKSDKFLQLIEKLDFVFKPSFYKALFGRRPAPILAGEAAELITSLPPAEQDDGLKLISLVNRKKGLVTTLLDEVQTL